MNIVIVSTASLRTPPEAYGGIERIAYNTVLGLEKLGHSVSLIAKEGSYTPKRGVLVEIEDDRYTPQAFDSACNMLGVVDCTIDFSHDKPLGLARPDLALIQCHQVMSGMGDMRNPVLISHGQWREKFPHVKEAEVIYQSIDTRELEFYDGVREDYYLYMGQKITEKRIDWCCEIAVRTSIPLFIYGPGWGQPECHALLRDYAEKYPDLVHNEGEISGVEKLERLQHAKALLHLPGALGWCEAGGIVVLEALACGTPCVVSNNGCLPEYITNGVNGYIAGSPDDAVRLLQTDALSYITPVSCSLSAQQYDLRLTALQWSRLCQRVADGEHWNV